MSRDAAAGAALAIGIDLGGTSLRLAAYRGLEAAAGAAAAAAGPGGAPPVALTPVAHHREPVGEPRDPDTMVARIADHVARLVDAARAAGDADDDAVVPVGLGIAAMLRDHRGTVANSPHLRWRDVDLGARLAARLGPRHPLAIHNDVNAITYGEYGLGAAVGARDVLAVYVGTGIGAGLIVDGRLAEGASHCAGELGHVKVAWDAGAAPCACGGRGCVEAYVGGSYLLRRIRGELAGGAPSLARDLAGAAPVTVAHVDDAAGRGDRWALELWQELAPLLAIALGNALALLNPARLVLGGGVLSRTPVLVELTLAALEIAAPAAALEPLTIAPAALGDDAGLVGAALLATRDARPG
ncbi:MAG: ROK family protein [Kofleriaceae bacterium]|nr:ROK family protein [Kofleriaceae bacterium]